MTLTYGPVSAERRDEFYTVTRRSLDVDMPLNNLWTWFKSPPTTPSPETQPAANPLNPDGLKPCVIEKNSLLGLA